MKCPAEKQCGACSMISVSYPETLHKKQKTIRRLFPDHDVDRVLGMAEPYHYRHKVYASFRNTKDHHLIAGMYQEGTHRVVQTSDCLIQHETANAIIRDFTKLAEEAGIRAYHEDTGTGILRHLYLRVSKMDGSVLLVIVTGSGTLPGSKKILSALLELHPEIKTVLISRNNRKTSMVLGDREKVIYGPGTITDELLGLHFRISARSFFQVNPVQTEVLYETALDLAELKETDEVLDLCCGIGTITLLAAKHSAHVTGIENVPQAIRDARANAKENHIPNVSFVCADIADYLRETEIKADVVIADPPRAGLGKHVSLALGRSDVKRIVYISCNPETQAKDCRTLESHGYRIQRIIPVDMFCFTPAVETVVCLSNKNAKPRDYVEIGVDAEDYYRIKDSENKKGK